jgi:hypothetical protein
MSTGNLWDLTNPKKPTCSFDPQAKRDIPWDWATWLASLNLTVPATISAKSFLFPLVNGIASNPMKVDSSSIVSPALQVVLARISVDPAIYDATLHFGKTFPITCHIITFDGQEEDQTLWFKLQSH